MIYHHYHTVIHAQIEKHTHNFADLAVAPVAPMGKEFDPIKLKHSFMASSKLEAPLRS
jgi:hypothetical protein